MATITGARRRPLVQIRSTAWSDRLGRAPFVLSIAALVSATLASLASLLVRDALRGPEVGIGSLQGTAVAVVAIAVPVLAVSMQMAERGSGRALLTWFGALVFIAYQGVLFLFATPFNAFFHVYVAMLSLSMWSLIALLSRTPVEAIAAQFDPRTHLRIYAGYLVISVAFFVVTWLRATVPAVLSTEPPAFLEGTGMTTGPGQILDLGFFMPLVGLTAFLAWHRRPWAYVLVGGQLVMLAIESASIALDQWFGHLADPSSTLVSVDLVPVFAVLCAIGVAVTVAFLRSMSGPSTTDDIGLRIDLNLPASTGQR
ncbi:MAG TPA: hypothetical protein VFV53_07295 [Candidatus Limnocylindrales bacterium]|nr:hypothetical protein [Candidatus Limnocylindrales bacterium]